MWSRKISHSASPRNKSRRKSRPVDVVTTGECIARRSLAHRFDLKRPSSAAGRVASNSRSARFIGLPVPFDPAPSRAAADAGGPAGPQGSLSDNTANAALPELMMSRQCKAIATGRKTLFTVADCAIACPVEGIHRVGFPRLDDDRFQTLIPHDDPPNRG